jgi:type VI secretion system secreted protein VgrG
MSVPGIVRKVLTQAGIADDRVRFAAHGDYTKREYVVQYRESDSNFLARLLEDEGISHFFEHDAHGYRMVFGDGPTSHPAVADDPTVEFHDPAWLVDDEDRECIHDVRDRHEVQSGRVSIDDFDFRRPGMDLLMSAEGDAFGALEWGDYPGGYVAKLEGGRYARLRHEACQWGRRVLHMTGGVRHLQVGHRFTLDGDPASGGSQEYLILAMEHRATERQGAEAETSASAGLEHWEYRVRLEVIPAQVPFRPQRVTPRPIVRGSQTAIVVGSKDEEIYTDEYGRVKVQFHWDREGRYDQNSSCWIRASQGLAGGNYGMMFLPRVGQEVIVDFLEGNPDCPLITGRVYNNDHMPPYALPAHKTRSCIKTNSSKKGNGTNEIRFEDKKGDEQLLLFAHRSLHVRSRGNTVQNAGYDHHHTVGHNKLELVKENKHSIVKLDLMEEIQGSKYLDVKGDVGEQFGNHSENLEGQYYLSATGPAVLESSQGITLRCGGNFITIDGSGVWINGVHVGLNSGGSPLAGTLYVSDAPEEPASAATAKPGHDTRYTPAGGDTPGEIDDLDPSGGDDDPTDDLTSWIEIEMVDELGRPWPHEAFEIEQPDGDMIRGTLDAKGRAHVSVRKPGTCQIRFPNLDADTWRRANA